MKKIILLFAFLIGFTSITNAQETVEVLMENALSEAVESDKHVLVKFEASWCGWCHRMTKQIKNKKLNKYFSDNYVMLPIVVFENGDKVKLENEGSRELIKKYKGESAGLPFWVILDKTGKVVADSFNDKGENLGCPGSKEEVAVFIQKLKATSEMSKKVEKDITQVFTIK